MDNSCVQYTLQERGKKVFSEPKAIGNYNFYWLEGNWIDPALPKSPCFAFEVNLRKRQRLINGNSRLPNRPCSLLLLLHALKWKGGRLHEWWPLQATTQHYAAILGSGAAAINSNEDLSVLIFPGHLHFEATLLHSCTFSQYSHDHCLLLSHTVQTL